jgi:hypothetical protein
MYRLERDVIVQALQEKGHKIFSKPYELNIIGIRINEPVPDSFNDVLYLLFTDENGKEITRQYPISTIPDMYWLKNPENPKGTAILVPDQYYNKWYIRKHRDQYLCLGQREPVKVYRDNAKNGRLIYDESTIEEGNFYIEIHKGSSEIPVTKWSAGCQVFQCEDHFDEFMNYCIEHRNRYSNTFTYTLLHQWYDTPKLIKTK